MYTQISKNYKKIVMLLFNKKYAIKKLNKSYIKIGYRDMKQTNLVHIYTHPRSLTGSTHKQGGYMIARRYHMPSMQ